MDCSTAKGPVRLPENYQFSHVQNADPRKEFAVRPARPLLRTEVSGRRQLKVDNSSTLADAPESWRWKQRLGEQTDAEKDREELMLNTTRKKGGPEQQTEKECPFGLLLVLTLSHMALVDDLANADSIAVRAGVGNSVRRRILKGIIRKQVRYEFFFFYHGAISSSSEDSKLRVARKQQKRGGRSDLSPHGALDGLAQAAASLVTGAPTSSSGVGRLGDGGCCAVSRRSKAVGVEEGVPIVVRVGCDVESAGCLRSQSWACKSLRTFARWPQSV